MPSVAAAAAMPLVRPSSVATRNSAAVRSWRAASNALAASWLPKSKHFVAANLAHGVSLHGCAPKLLEGFIRKGDGEGLDGTCLERIPRPLFLMPLGVKPPPGVPR